MEAGLPEHIAQQVKQLVEELGVSQSFRISEEFVSEVLGLVADQPAQLDLKIASAAIAEMRDAFAMFGPYENVPKVSIFGSARTQPDDPLYLQARDVARRLAALGWMVVTGAGPGIMQAAMEGAGRERSIGVSIRLPFETGANPIIAGDEKHVSMKYFFTRKLMLVKESRAFVCLPGGFGTLDETFELLTLTQTGKGMPVPIVFLDTPGDPFWEGVQNFVNDQLITRGLVSAGDTAFYKITDSCEEAVREIERFYANYDSVRYIGEHAVIRLQHVPTVSQLAELNERFADVVHDDVIRSVEPYGVERRQNDRLDLPRIAFRFDKHGYAELRQLIDHVNGFAP